MLNKSMVASRARTRRTSQRLGRWRLAVRGAMPRRSLLRSRGRGPRYILRGCVCGSCHARATQPSNVSTQQGCLHVSPIDGVLPPFLNIPSTPAELLLSYAWPGRRAASIKLATNGSRRLASRPRRRQLLLQLADQQTRAAARGAPRPRRRRRIHRNGPCVGVAVQLRLPAIASPADGRRRPDVPRRPAPPAAAREPSRPGWRRFRPQGAGAGAVAVAGLVAEDGSLRGRE
jgi:hypothetical protein